MPRPTFLPPPLPRRSPRHLPKPPARCSTSTPPAHWSSLKAQDRCLRLSLTLPCGQAFRWHHTGTFPFPCHLGQAVEYAGAIGHHLFVLRQAEKEPPDGVDDPIWYRELTGNKDGDAVLRDYLRADVDLSDIFVRICDADARFNHLFPFFRGVRVVREPPVECLFAFICSANNNLARIGSMVNFLAKRYGKELGKHCNEMHYEFPTVDQLAQATEEELREARFGYRARYIVGAASQLQKVAEKEDMTAEDMLLSWRELSREDLAAKLVQLPGVGRKVASCIGLFSLDQWGEVPVDTHIWQIACRYLPDLEAKSLTERVYERVGGFFRGRFGEETAGLAQTILFCAELGGFQELVPDGAKVPKKKKPRKRKIKEEGNSATGKEEAVVKEEEFVNGMVIKEEVMEVVGEPVVNEVEQVSRRETKKRKSRR